MHTILFLEVTDAAWVKIRPTAVFSKSSWSSLQRRHYAGGRESVLATA